MKNPCCGERAHFVSVPLQPHHTKVTFECSKCQGLWQSGKGGGKYTQYLKDRGLTVYYPEKLLQKQLQRSA